MKLLVSLLVLTNRAQDTVVVDEPVELANQDFDHFLCFNDYQN